MFRNFAKDKFIVFFLFVSGFILTSNAADIEIKSLRSFTEGNERSLPVLIINDQRQDRLVIDFDLQAETLPDISIVFRFCDRNWNPVNNIFLLNQGQNIAYNLGYSVLPSTIQGAKYNFRNAFPDNRGTVSFPFSGKWVFYVTDAQDTSIVYGSGRFYVVYPANDQNIVLKKELLEDKTYYPLELGRIVNLTSKLELKDELFPAFVTGMEVVENKKIYSPYFIDKSFNTNIRQFYWNGNRSFSFIIRDIRPGNEYRETDLRNSNRFIGPTVKAQIDGIEVSRFDRQGRRDIDGAEELSPPSNDFSDYLNVQFSLRPPSDIGGDIFLTGAFNNWRLLPEYLMENHGGLYTKTLQLKRGLYDYQYVTADIINNKLQNENWIQLEGNYWETTNEYHVFIFYNDPNYGGYDRIISYQLIRSK